MRVWLINPSEPLPSDSKGARLQRTGQLAEALVARGHEVVYWSGNFNHFTKRNRFPSETVLEHRERYQIRLLHGPTYSNAVSLRRIAHHYRVARGFLRCAGGLTPPDLIYSSVGPIETSAAAARFARPRGIPLVLDVRDLWPDVFVDVLPRWTRGPARWALWPMDRGIRYACRSATAIIATGQRFLDWGLAKAGRPQGPLDRHFPQACDSRPPSPDLLDDARELWRRHGIDGSSDAFTACFFGAVGTHAEIPTVIEAARRLRNEGRSIRFVVCGTGDCLAKYKRMAEGIDGVVFPGWVGAAEIWTLMRMARTGLAPYRNSKDFRSSLPNKSIEYLSAGLPLLSSLTGELERLLAEHGCGVTYAEGDSGSLVTALEKLFDDGARLETMAANAFALYREKFTAEKVYGELCGYLEDLASRGRRGEKGSENVA